MRHPAAPKELGTQPIICPCIVSFLQLPIPFPGLCEEKEGFFLVKVSYVAPKIYSRVKKASSVRWPKYPIALYHTYWVVTMLTMQAVLLIIPVKLIERVLAMLDAQ